MGACETSQSSPGLSAGHSQIPAVVLLCGGVSGVTIHILGGWPLSVSVPVCGRSELFVDELTTGIYDYLSFALPTN